MLQAAADADDQPIFFPLFGQQVGLSAFPVGDKDKKRFVQFFWKVFEDVQAPWTKHEIRGAKTGIPWPWYKKYVTLPGVRQGVINHIT